MEDSPDILCKASTVSKQNYVHRHCCIVRVNRFMSFNSLGHQEKRDKVSTEKTNLSTLSVSEVLRPSILHRSFRLHVWPHPTCMTRNHSSSLYPSIIPVTSSFHFSAPRPELPLFCHRWYHLSGLLGISWGICSVKYILIKVIMCFYQCSIGHVVGFYLFNETQFIKCLKLLATHFTKISYDK